MDAPSTLPPTGDAPGIVDFRTEPARYRHWRLAIEGRVATLGLDVDEHAPLRPGYELKLNSYDLGVDIELYDAVQRLRFEHPEVGAVVIRSLKDRVFCAGANIRMLGQSSHAQKVNFCKFTNETRNGIEDASAHSGQRYLCAVRGSCAGGGYELALACEEILLVDDGASAVSLPELPLLAVLPGTGGLTRLVDKRHVRRDHADVFCTLEEGIRGQRALEWRLVDALLPASRFDEAVRERAEAAAALSDRPEAATGIALTPLARRIDPGGIEYSTLRIELDRGLRSATFVVRAPRAPVPPTLRGIHAEGAAFWPLTLARELDDAILHLRSNEEEIGTWVFRTEGAVADVLAADAALEAHAADWFVREVRLYLKRVLKRLDVSSRSLVAVIEPGSCFAGTLLELALACDRGYMLDGSFADAPQAEAVVVLSPLNFGAYPMANGLTRLAARHLHAPEAEAALRARCGEPLRAAEAARASLVTVTPDDLDWEDEIRLALESRASFSPDALTGMEANLRFVGPETLESKIFARLSAWQNWIFQRPNAVGERGALVLYGSGRKPEYDKRRA